jgi:hypothetical protein
MSLLLKVEFMNNATEALCSKLHNACAKSSSSTQRFLFNKVILVTLSVLENLWRKKTFRRSYFVCD